MTTAKLLIFLCNGVEICEREFSITMDGEVLSVESRAFRLPIYLLRNPQSVITKEEPLGSVWDDVAVTQNSFF